MGTGQHARMGAGGPGVHRPRRPAHPAEVFRRCTDYLKAVDKGFTGNLVDWLLASSATPSRDENDRVLLRDTTEVHLSDLLQQRNQRITFQADLLDLTFVEK